MNHEHYHQRLDFVTSLLQLNGLEAAKIDPVEYDMNSKHPYNNFIYLVTLSSPSSTAIRFRTSQSTDVQSSESQPGTVPMPANVTSLIFRLANSNPNTGINNTNRVENEVACMTLARQALASKYSHIVPDVYAWTSMDSGQGCTVQQYMPGTMPDKVFGDLTLQAKTVLLAQMAEILAQLQEMQVPQTVDKFGGLKFDSDGKIVSAQSTLYKREPKETYKDFIRDVFSVKFQETDENPVMQGWRENGVRARLENFIDGQLEHVLQHNDGNKVLVHSDFTTNNLLFNATTLQVTAILDFDFSYVATAAEEFMLFSFSNIPGGHLPGPLEDGEQLVLRNAMMSGNFPSISSNVDSSSAIEWDVAKAWDEALVQAGAIRPRTIPRFEELADLYWLADILSPFELDNPVMRARRTSAQLKEIRDKTESRIVRFLDKHERTL